MLHNKVPDLHVTCSSFFTRWPWSSNAKIGTWWGGLMQLLMHVYAESVDIVGTTLSQVTTPWDWFDKYYLLNLSTRSPAMWVCYTLPRSHAYLSGCLGDNLEWRIRGHSLSSRMTRLINPARRYFGWERGLHEADIVGRSSWRALWCMPYWVTDWIHKKKKKFDMKWRERKRTTWQRTEKV